MSVLPFWIILSSLFLLLGHRHRLTLYHKIPAFMKRILKICFYACLIFFLFVESCIIWGISRDTGENLDYILVLGAGLNGDKPSAVLEMRLEKARLYLQEHPQTVVIVSGGQGPTEPVSEAESMKNWLMEKGIPNSRIIMEDKSTTTAENIRYSLREIWVELAFFYKNSKNTSFLYRLVVKSILVIHIYAKRYTKTAQK
ncbi:YdcF family protein [Lachnospiraceae bacterium]|nr:YdcF family protein [Lachnospiraceae bacterium]